jgi:hypothetical protein
MPLASPYFLKSSSWAVDPTEVLFTAPLYPACALTIRTTFSLFSLTVYLPQRGQKIGFPFRALQKFALFSSALITIEVHSELSPTLAGVHHNVMEYIMYLLYYRSYF